MQTVSLSSDAGPSTQTTIQNGSVLAGHAGITGAIAGVGSTGGPRNVRWGVAGGIVWAWVLTIPASGIIAALAWWIGRLVL